MQRERVEIRKWCIEKAIAIIDIENRHTEGHASWKDSPKHTIDTAKKLEEWLERPTATTAETVELERRPDRPLLSPGQAPVPVAGSD